MYPKLSAGQGLIMKLESAKVVLYFDHSHSLLINQALIIGFDAVYKCVLQSKKKLIAERFNVYETKKFFINHYLSETCQMSISYLAVILEINFKFF